MSAGAAPRESRLGGGFVVLGAGPCSRLGAASLFIGVALAAAVAAEGEDLAFTGKGLGIRSRWKRLYSHSRPVTPL